MGPTGKQAETPGFETKVDQLELSCPLPVSGYDRVLLAHGSGGSLMQEMIRNLILPEFRNEFLEELNDGAVFRVGDRRLAFTTDSFVVHPLFFPGGDIGRLAVAGTVNDLAMCGAEPLYLSAGFIIEEGLEMSQLRLVIRSMRDEAEKAGVRIVTGDTKVVDRGKGDGIFINTAGVGLVGAGVDLRPANVAPGDSVIINGPVGLHGIAVMSAREGLEFESPVLSDCAPLGGLVRVMLGATREIHALRDPTRGGVAATLNEIVSGREIGIRLDESAIPVTPAVEGACEMLGFDPLYVANEGKLLAFVPRERAPLVLEAMRAHPLGRGSAIIGEVGGEMPGRVVMTTLVGGQRIVDMPPGEQLPRIC